MRILNLNCQHGEQPLLEYFLGKVLTTQSYDFLVLQEVNKKVLGFLNNLSYKTIRAFNGEARQDSELCIVYRKGYKVIEKNFKSFSSIHKDSLFGFKHPSIGLLSADFEIHREVIRIADIHLHAGLDRRIRIIELQLAKKLLLEQNKIPTILAGDFNAVLPYERPRLSNILAPVFSWMTKYIGPTLDSRYTENLPYLPNRIAAFFGIFNIGIQLWADHVFVDQQTTNIHTIQCKVLHDRVSDHLPVEIIINVE